MLSFCQGILLRRLLWHGYQFVIWKRKQSSVSREEPNSMEVKLILQNAAKLSMAEASSIARDWQKRLSGKKFSDSALLIREDRDR
jgi:hypothetical protein